MRAPTRKVAAVLVAALCGLVTTAAGHGAGEVGPVVTGLSGPRGLEAGPGGRLVVTQADGSVDELTRRGHHAGRLSTLAQLPATYIAPAVSMTGRGQTYLLTAGGPPGTGAGTLYRWNPGRGAVPLADITAYQHLDPDPWNVELTPEESNPFGVAALPGGGALVVDAAGNDLLRVSPDGQIVTAARFRPREVTVPDGLPPVVTDPLGHPLTVPPAGTAVLSEAVPTAVTVGSDGTWYVGELRGFPAEPGTSQVWRVEPGSVDAVCDPERPQEGDCRLVADGFTSVVDLEAGPDGSLYVLELTKEGWIGLQLGRSPEGSLVRLAPDGTRTELGAGELMLPGGVAVTHRGEIFVTSPVLGPGTVRQIHPGG